MKKIAPILKAVDKKKVDIVHFLQKLIQTPSLTGEEGQKAQMILKKMKELNYDNAWIDSAGNVVGILHGKNKGKSILYNSHIDHVPPGEMEDPYSGEIMNGHAFNTTGDVVYGRSACDMSGQIASTVMAGGILKKFQRDFSGDLIISCSVTEEHGTSLGSRVLIEENNLHPDLVIVTEATNLNLLIGHRGSVHPRIDVYGKSAHSSNPKRGINALYKTIEIISEIRKSMIPKLPSHPVIGETTLSINTLRVEPSVVNVVPSFCSCDLDIRNTPNYSVEEIMTDIADIVANAKKKDPQMEADVVLPENEETSYTGYKRKIKSVLLPFYTDPESNFVSHIKEVIENVLSRPITIGTWTFGTDASYFSEIAGIPTVGFGPGNEKVAHSRDEHMPVDDLIEATKVYAILPLLMKEER